MNINLNFSGVPTIIQCNLMNPGITNNLQCPTNTTNIRLNFSQKLCPDSYIGEIKNNNGLGWTNTAAGNPVNANTVVNYSSINKENNYLILILESPHFYEYDINSKDALGPAQGKTGNNIKNYLIDCLNTNNQIKGLFTKGYEVVVLNAVQYQCSQGISPLKQGVRDKNFSHFWGNGFSNDLIDRINAFSNGNNNLIIVDACTRKLKLKLVEPALSASLTHYISTHPSSWWSPKNRYIK